MILSGTKKPLNIDCRKFFAARRVVDDLQIEPLLAGRRDLEFGFDALETLRAPLQPFFEEFFALATRCPHQGGDLAQGHLTCLVESSEPGEYRTSRHGEILRCPWHQWEYDIRTGKSWVDPRTVRVRNFPVSVEPGATLVEGPYVAETFPVSVEDQYVVVEM